MIKNQNKFIGFNKNNLYLLSVDDRLINNAVENFYDSLIYDKNWHSGLLSEFRNVFIINKYANYISLFKESNPFTKVTYIINDNDNENISYDSLYLSDFILCHKSINLECFNLSKIKNINFFENTLQLITLISNIIKYNGDKPYDYLVPLTKNVPYIEFIDDLNEKGIDVFIKFHSFYENDSLEVNNFNDYIDYIFNHIEYILVKESLLQQFNNLNQEKEILKIILADGAKVEVHQ